MKLLFDIITEIVYVKNTSRSRTLRFNYSDSVIPKFREQDFQGQKTDYLGKCFCIE